MAQNFSMGLAAKGSMMLFNPNFGILDLSFYWYGCEKLIHLFQNLIFCLNLCTDVTWSWIWGSQSWRQNNTVYTDPREWTEKFWKVKGGVHQGNLIATLFFFPKKNLCLFSVKILKKEGAGMLKEVLPNLFLKKIQQDMKLYPRSLGVSIAAGYQRSSLT